MGAWEVQPSPGAPGNKIMRQVVPVWPQCWGYSCTGPTTYWGPQHGSVLGPGVQVTVDVMLEAAAVYKIASLYGRGDADGEADGDASGDGSLWELALSTNGTWAFGGAHGSVAFSVGKWAKLAVQSGAGWTAALVDGTLVHNATASVGTGWNVKVSLDRYVFAGMDNFAVTRM